MHLHNAIVLAFASLAASHLAEPRSSSPNNATSAFGYLGVQGPLGWAGLSPNNALCSTGTQQSPINIDGSVPAPYANPKVAIPNGWIDYENLGTTVEAISPIGTTQFLGKTYQLKQYHFHTPSEHLINGQHYPLEVHFVHQAAGTYLIFDLAEEANNTLKDGSYLVLGAVFDFTYNNAVTTPLVYSLGQQILQIRNPGARTRVQSVRFEQIINLFQNSRLSHYSGSLTTPPCTQGITWLVAQTPLAIDTASYLNIKEVLKFNSRFTQNTPGKDNLIQVAVDQFPFRSIGLVDQTA